jgi:hypothetical protein
MLNITTEIYKLKKQLQEKEQKEIEYKKQLKEKELELNSYKEKKYEEIEKNGHVYVIKTDGGYKVGKTKDINNRVKGLQTGNMKDIEVIFDFRTSNSDLLERIVHYILDRYRCNSNREFFDCNIDYIKNIVNIIGNTMDTLKSTYQSIPNDSSKASELPGKGRKLLVFSDSRQSAAYFAPYLEDTYQRLLERRMIWLGLSEVFSETERPVSFKRLLNQILISANSRRLFDRGMDDDDREASVKLWLSRELVAFDHRQSLEGLGMLDFSLFFPDDFENPLPTGQGVGTLIIDQGYNQLTNTLSFTEDQNISARLVLEGINQSNYTASVSQGSLIISALSQTTGYSEIDCSTTFLSAPYSLLSGSYVFTFNNQLSSFYDNGYIFVPNPLTGSISSLYSTYGDVDYEFNLNTFSILILQLSDNSYVEYRILNVNNDGLSNVSFTVDKLISNTVVSELINNKVQTVLFLTRIEDETNAYLTFTKREGQTSYGFVIPSNLAPDVLANIDTITNNYTKRISL